MMVNEGSGDHSCTTGQSFVFNSAFISTDGKGARCQDLDKVGICACRSKALVLTKSATQIENRGLLQILNKVDSVGNSGIQGVHFKIPIKYAK
jgi:hypothetical protein